MKRVSLSAVLIFCGVLGAGFGGAIVEAESTPPAAPAAPAAVGAPVAPGAPPHGYSRGKDVGAGVDNGAECKSNADCKEPKTFCAKPTTKCDGPGKCRPQPEFCPSIFDPVCGCDDKMYGNWACAAVNGVNTKQPGPCKK